MELYVFVIVVIVIALIGLVITVIVVAVFLVMKIRKYAQMIEEERTIQPDNENETETGKEGFEQPQELNAEDFTQPVIPGEEGSTDNKEEEKDESEGETEEEEEEELCDLVELCKRGIFFVLGTIGLIFWLAIFFIMITNLFVEGAFTVFIQVLSTLLILYDVILGSISILADYLCDLYLAFTYPKKSQEQLIELHTTLPSLGAVEAFFALSDVAEQTILFNLPFLLSSSSLASQIVVTLLFSLSFDNRLYDVFSLLIDPDWLFFSLFCTESQKKAAQTVLTDLYQSIAQLGACIGTTVAFTFTVIILALFSLNGFSLAFLQNIKSAAGKDLAGAWMMFVPVLTFSVFVAGYPYIVATRVASGPVGEGGTRISVVVSQLILLIGFGILDIIFAVVWLVTGWEGTVVIFAIILNVIMAAGYVVYILLGCGGNN